MTFRIAWGEASQLVSKMAVESQRSHQPFEAGGDGLHS